MPVAKKRRNALFLVAGIVVLILAAYFIVTSGVLALWLDPEPETNSTPTSMTLPSATAS